MSDEAIISPSWDDTKEFLSDQDADKDTMGQLYVIRKDAEKKGEGDMMAYYPVIYAERNDKRRGHKFDYDILIIPQGNDFEDKVEQGYNHNVLGNEPLHRGEVSNKNVLPEGISYS